MTTDYNVRDVFFLFIGRCGHKWVAERCWDACPTCGDCGDWKAGEYDHVVAKEPITVNFGVYALPKVKRRIQAAIRANRRKKRKTAVVISLVAHRPGPAPVL
jgi:hypothetical protein